MTVTCGTCIKLIENGPPTALNETHGKYCDNDITDRYRNSTSDNERIVLAIPIKIRYFLFLLHHTISLWYTIRSHYIHDKGILELWRGGLLLFTILKNNRDVRLKISSVKYIQNSYYPLYTFSFNYRDVTRYIDIAVYNFTSTLLFISSSHNIPQYVFNFVI